ncbi:PRC-barrel domain-containing protein [Roseibacterium sp. SDUM158017]|uniref:PRC-barrel domain-containing protein n=1 Tax=Roseicyclus salinarum TaxID=3036773 RepID=UPI002415371A|nr:PRC-barrel domain-containing protein [Roseibacterium sp. SDUM158017]MDG4650287.1 PRC-barrel domain-containing protein [Roseibacterium sp. SDUM158017]
MKPKNLMLTTALAAVLAIPAGAQESDAPQADAQGAAQSQIGSYSVGEFLDLAVVGPDGSDIGEVDAVIEGQDGTQVLVRLQDRTVALPLDAFSMSEDGESLTVDRSMDELQQMAAHEPAGEMELGEDTMMADAMRTGPSGNGGTDQMAEGETTVTGDETEGQIAEGEVTMTGDETGGQMAEGETSMTGDETEGQMAEGETSMPGDETGGQMAEGETTMTGQQGANAQFAGMTVGEILGMNVVAADGSDVGEIDYIYQGSEGYMAVIGIGGFLGLGEHTVALPLSDFSMNETGDGLVVQSRTEADLEAMQEVDESDLQGLPDDHMIGA